MQLFTFGADRPGDSVGKFHLFEVNFSNLYCCLGFGEKDFIICWAKLLLKFNRELNFFLHLFILI